MRGLFLMAIPFKVSAQIIFTAWAVAQPFCAGIALVVATPAVAQQATPTTAKPATQPTVITSAVYQCDQAKGFSAQYLSNETVRATFGTKVIVLPQVQSASGAKYSDGSVTILTKADEATVEVGNQKLFTNCVAVGGLIQGLW
jgi:membrane-bound inhibitor of C-type lysozyme